MPRVIRAMCFAPNESLDGSAGECQVGRPKVGTEREPSQGFDPNVLSLGSYGGNLHTTYCSRGIPRKVRDLKSLKGKCPWNVRSGLPERKPGFCQARTGMPMPRCRFGDSIVWIHSRVGGSRPSSKMGNESRAGSKASTDQARRPRVESPLQSNGVPVPFPCPAIRISQNTSRNSRKKPAVWAGKPAVWVFEEKDG